MHLFTIFSVMMCIDICGCLIQVAPRIFFFKQKTAYEVRISDWSSDVCSSDLRLAQMLTRISGRIVHQPLDHVSPLSVSVMLEIGREAVHGEEIGRASCRERVCQYV